MIPGGEKVALVVIAALVGDDEVFDPLVGMPGPRNEVVDFRGFPDRFLAIEAPIVLKLAQGLSNRVR